MSRMIWWKKALLRVWVWHHDACQVTHGDSEGLLFLLHPFTNNELFFLLTFSCSCKIITIHHERPCRIEISHPRGRKFNQGRGLPSPRLNSDPEGEISLSYIDRLLIDRFSPTFRRVYVRTFKLHENLKFLTFYSLGYIISEFTSVFIGH